MNDKQAVETVIEPLLRLRKQKVLDVITIVTITILFVTMLRLTSRLSTACPQMEFLPRAKDPQPSAQEHTEEENITESASQQCDCGR